MASGGHDLATMAAGIGAELKARKETIAVAESSAGGLISAALLAVPGASAYFLGGGVIYTQAARRALLRVPDESVRGIRASTWARRGGWPRRVRVARRATATATRRATRASRWPGRSSGP